MFSLKISSAPNSNLNFQQCGGGGSPGASSAAAAAAATGGGAGFRPSKICRRWSLDNLSPDSRREGYVRDLRARHKAQQIVQRDEGYPFMLTERNNKNHHNNNNNGSSSGFSSQGGSRPGSASPPPLSSFTPPPPPPLSLKRGRSYSLDEEVAGPVSLGRHLMVALARPRSGGAGGRLFNRSVANFEVGGLLSALSCCG